MILGNRLYQASVHSVRPLTERERILFDASDDGAARWRQLSDMVPKREFADLAGEEPGPDELEQPDLPLEPGSDTLLSRLRPHKPMLRFSSKMSMDESGFPIPELPPSPLYLRESPSPVADEVNEYSPTARDGGVPSGEPGNEEEQNGHKPSSRRVSVTSTTPLLERAPEEDNAETEIQELETKRARLEEESDAELHHALREVQEGYLMNIDLDLTSNRQQKLFKKDPVAFLAKKVNSGEVNYRRLSEDEKVLCERAKDSKISSFLKASAVRRCLSYQHGPNGLMDRCFLGFL